MKLLLLTAPAFLCLHALAQGLPDIKFKEGLWEEVTTSSSEAVKIQNIQTVSKCHSHDHDAEQMRQMNECRIVSSSQTDAGWQMEANCSKPGIKLTLQNTGIITDEEHITIISRASYPQNGQAGIAAGSSSSVAMTYKGPCPANVRPGDWVQTTSSGKSIVIPDPSRNAALLSARTREAGIMASSSITSASQTALNQRPAAYSNAHPSGPPISNADVLALVSAGLDDDVILAKINAAASAKFDTSIDGLKALKAGGVSNNVIKIMVGRATAAEAEAAANSEDPNLMHQPGVYALISGRDGQVHLLQLEHTHAAGENSSGNSVAMVYLHTKKHIRESLNNPTSPVKIEDRNPTFYIYIPTDTQSFGGNDLSARDFELLKLRVKSRTREVETSSAGISGMGASGIEDKARQPTIAQKVKPGIYMVKVSTPLKPGEYAFQHELEGVFYDFTITESR